MQIVEIFESIQGEGGYMGTPCIFIRTSGCNLTCPFCDTKESWKAEGNMDLTPKEIVDLIQEKYTSELVVITGGEPCMQPELQKLCTLLRLTAGKLVAIETNGTLPTPKYDVNWVACAPKAENDYKIHPECKYDELKFVVTPEFDESVITPELIASTNYIWLQPEGSDMQNMWKKCYAIAQNCVNVRVGVQLHKLMEVQ